jgi:hypothetical protein
VHKFFHRVATRIEETILLNLLLVNGSVSTDHAEIKEHIVQFYDMLYTEQFS